MAVDEDFQNLILILCILIYLFFGLFVYTSSLPLNLKQKKGMIVIEKAVVLIAFIYWYEHKQGSFVAIPTGTEITRTDTIKLWPHNILWWGSCHL